MAIQPDQPYAALMSLQQLAAEKADALALRESETTLTAFREAMDAKTCETQALMLENAALREQLAALKNQQQEREAVYARERAAESRRAQEEIAALNAKCEKFKGYLRDLNSLNNQKTSLFGAYYNELCGHFQGTSCLGPASAAYHNAQAAMSRILDEAVKK
jgi:predicted RNase H-like nuclease (RuvC/YqgF family)